jgi:Transmembrane family 220, helix
MKTTTAWSRTAALIATLMFMWMAALQLNDPDPLYWFVVYAAVAVVAAAAVVGRRLPRFALVTLGAVTAGVLIAAPGFIDYLQSGNWGSIAEHMNDEEPYIEQGREFVGLLIAAAALLLFIRRSG